MGELLEGMYNVPSAVGGKPDPDVGLEVTNEITFGTFKRRIAFDVTCAVEGEAHPQVILQCRGFLKMPTLRFESPSMATRASSRM